MRRFYLGFVWLLAVGLAAPGCFKLTHEFDDDILKKVDDLLAVFDRAIKQSAGWQQQSADWQKTLQELQAKFAEDNRELADRIGRLSTELSGQFHTGVQSDFKYITTGVQSMLNSAISALADGRSQIEKEKDPKKRKSIFLGILKHIADEVWREPTITQFSPSDVTVDWNKPGQAILLKGFGWGFERPKGEQLAMFAEVNSGPGTGTENTQSGNLVRALRSAVLSRTTDFLVQITVNTGDLRRTDKQLMIKCGLKSHELPIIHIDQKPKPSTLTPAPIVVPPLPREPKNVPILRGGRHVIEGRISTLTIAAVMDGAYVEVQDAVEVQCGLVDKASTLIINATGGDLGKGGVTFTERIDGGSTVEIWTKGDVIVKQKIDGKSKVIVHYCRDFQVMEKISGGLETRVEVIYFGSEIVALYEPPAWYQRGKAYQPGTSEGDQYISDIMKKVRERFGLTRP